MEVMVEYAPIIIVVIIFLMKNRLFVTPEQLQKERRDFTAEIERRFLSLAAFREYEKRMDDNFEAVHKSIAESNNRFNNVDRTLEHIVDILIKHD